MNIAIARMGELANNSAVKLVHAADASQNLDGLAAGLKNMVDSFTRESQSERRVLPMPPN